VRAQQIEKLDTEPLFVANLDREPVSLRKILQEWFESRQKFLSTLERRLVEVTELEEQRSELGSHQIHRFEKQFQVCFAILQNLFMRD
jgi:hypothetical protein